MDQLERLENEVAKLRLAVECLVDLFAAEQAGDDERVKELREAKLWVLSL
jgi:hypothetical protein